MTRKPTKPTWLAPEVVQSSSIDCGPASLKCLLEGFGISASYGRLREACQTAVDGTSLDAIEEAARALGLDATQRLLPVEHLFLKSSPLWPGLVVVRLPNGMTHFVLVWSVHGPWLQIMDPATGRSWVRREDFVRRLLIHSQPVAAEEWKAWAVSPEALAPLREQATRTGITRPVLEALIRSASSDTSWRRMAQLHAAVRLTESLVSAKALRRGAEASRLVESLATGAGEAIPEEHWPVRLLEGDQLMLRGAVVLSVPRRLTSDDAEGDDARATAPPELRAALEEAPARPLREVWRMLREDGLLAPWVLAGAALLASAGVALEAALLRGLIEVATRLGPFEHRAAGLGATLLFIALILGLERWTGRGTLRLGSHLETRLRASLLEKVPRLPHHYFRSRLVSDMAERSHNLALTRTLPGLGFRLLRTLFDLALITAGILWLDPRSAPIVLPALMLLVAIPLLANPALVEGEMRHRTHTGALTVFHLDALLGLTALRAHGGETTLLREHESLLTQWRSAGRALWRRMVATQSLQDALGMGFAAALVYSRLAQGAEGGGMLLLLYWGMALPASGQELGALLRRYPIQHSLIVRLLEPLRAPTEEVRETPPAPVRSARGARLVFEGVGVDAGGHPILGDLGLTLDAGSHVAIVGASGAGKSSLVALLLGLHPVARGTLTVDGRPFRDGEIHALRERTAWVDPSVHLWNRSVLANVGYGASREDARRVGHALELSDLITVLESLPDGLQTVVGDGGGLLSGGQGQRVRLARALVREAADLVLLDEAFTGLERDLRVRLVEQARRLWSGATLLCVTHDIESALQFPRVLVFDGGRIVEDGDPGQLAQREGSRLGAMLREERLFVETLFGADRFQSIRLEEGGLR